MDLRKILLALLLTLFTINIKAQSARNEVTAFDNNGNEIHPKFPGGNVALARFVQKNLKWPAGPKHAIQISVTFVIEKDGTLSNVKVLKPVLKDYDIEAVRVVKSSPRWIPGKANKGVGWKPIRMMMSLPINFNLK